MAAVADKIDSTHKLSIQSMALKAEKKLIGSFAGRTVIQQYYIDDVTASLLDNLHYMLKLHYGRKVADKVVKNIIKMCVKIGVLSRNDQFNEEEQSIMNQFSDKLRSLLMTLISFHDVAFSYDYDFINVQADQMKMLLVRIVRGHLSDKSRSRVSYVFHYLTNSQFMDRLFLEDCFKEPMDKLVLDVSQLLEHNK